MSPPGTGERAFTTARVFPFAALPALRALLDERRAVTPPEVPWVFAREDGSPVRDIRSPWVTALRKAGLPARLVHDLRRSAVRNMEAAGVPRSVAMSLSGHKTELIYRRYAIVAAADQRAAVEKLAVLHGARAPEPTPTPARVISIESRRRAG
jgi:integrase